VSLESLDADDRVIMLVVDLESLAEAGSSGDVVERSQGESRAGLGQEGIAGVFGRGIRVGEDGWVGSPVEMERIEGRKGVSSLAKARSSELNSWKA
jgi:hypothetical protein